MREAGILVGQVHLLPCVRRRADRGIGEWLVQQRARRRARAHRLARVGREESRVHVEPRKLRGSEAQAADVEQREAQLTAHGEATRDVETVRAAACLATQHGELRHAHRARRDAFGCLHRPHARQVELQMPGSGHRIDRRLEHPCAPAAALRLAAVGRTQRGGRVADPDGQQPYSPPLQPVGLRGGAQDAQLVEVVHVLALARLHARVAVGRATRAEEGDGRLCVTAALGQAAPQQVAANHDPRAPLARLAVHSDHVVGVAVEDRLQPPAEVYDGAQRRWVVVAMREAQDLRVGEFVVGVVTLVAEIDHRVPLWVVSVEEAAHLRERVAVERLDHSAGGQPERNHPWQDVREVEVEALVVLEAVLRSRDQTACEAHWRHRARRDGHCALDEGVDVRADRTKSGADRRRRRDWLRAAGQLGAFGRAVGTMPRNEAVWF